MTGQRDGPLIVLDDDPTGTQAMENVPVLLEWDDTLVRAALRSRPPALHLLTNSRAFPPARAAEIVRGAAQAAVDALGRPRLVLRGDSTLRAHLLEEYLAVRDIAFPGRTPPLLLVPALPHAGRITVGGVHLLVQGAPTSSSARRRRLSASSRATSRQGACRRRTQRGACSSSAARTCR